MYTDVPQRVSHPPGVDPLENHDAYSPALAPLFDLRRLSFGATENYESSGGQPVFADESPATSPLNIAVSGLDIPRDLGRGGRAVGAFVIGDRKIRIRIQLSVGDSSTRFGFVRAISESGEERIRETPVVFEDGATEVDLPVVGLTTKHVGIFNENWKWECRPEGGEFAAIECEYAGKKFDSFPIRLYFAAAASVSVCPRESFYHVACVHTDAMNQIEAERDVWKNFSSFHHGRMLTNARGQQLGFWRNQKPGATETDFIDRDAQQLVVRTDSSCRGWAELFREALAIHGIAATVRAVRPRLSAVHPLLGLPSFIVPDGRGGKSVARTIGILVKPFNWKPADQISPFPFSAEECESVSAKFRWKLDNPVDPHTARWPEPDAQDLLRSAHNNPASDDRARGIFGNHAVVLVMRGDKETWYDPSFGFGPHDSLLSYENDLLGKGEENHGGLFAIIGWKRELRANLQTGAMEECSGGLLLGAAPAPKHAVLEACDPG